MIQTSSPSPSNSRTDISTGIVVAMDSDLARVQTFKAVGCGTCSCSRPCSSTSGEPGRIISAHNPGGAKVGDLVQFHGPSEKTRARAAFLVYIIPLGGLLAGAVAGALFAPFQNQDLNATLGALTGLGLTFSVIQAYVKSKSSKGPGTHATIIRIISDSGNS